MWSSVRCILRAGSRYTSVVSMSPAITQNCYNSTRPSTQSPKKQTCQDALGISSMISRVHLTPFSQKHQAYILPTTIVNRLYKKTIINPLKPNEYFLPSVSSVDQEKLTPGLDHDFPKIDPDLLQSVVDQGAPPIVKYCMPYLMRVRYKKMKKHKLKKFRKRMLPLHRKLSDAKKRKKEKAIQAMEKAFHEEGQTFKAEDFVNKQLQEARRGGYRVDIFETRIEAKTQ